MTVTDEFLANNEQYAAGFAKGDLPLPPGRKVAVLACMDARLDPARALGLEEGDAHVIRNAGGVVSEDALRSLAISQRLLGTQEIILIHHTDCGMLTFEDDGFKQSIVDDTGLRPRWAPSPCCFRPSLPTSSARASPARPPRWQAAPCRWAKQAGAAAENPPRRVRAGQRRLSGGPVDAAQAHQRAGDGAGDGAGCGWFTYDPEARQVIRNRYAAELMGLSLEEHGTFGAPDMVIDTVAMKDGRSVPREDRPLTRAMRGEHTDHEEFAYYLPDGTERILLSSARPIYDAAGRTVVGAVQISLDISERKRAEEQRQLLTKELDHRVKNNLAIVQALAEQTLRDSSSLSEATTVLGARLAALSRAQDVLTRNSWAEGDLREVIDASVLVQAPHGRIEIAGPVVKLSPRQVMAVTLAMHELTTNAVKYGALGERGGRVRIDWQIVKERPRHVLRLTWLESGGPPVAGEPEKKGFGSRLLEQVAAGEGGRAEMRFTDDGLRCTLVLPMQTTIVADEAPALG